ncbi:Uncharacterised protein [uncultured archaeon]|nr:Uncharacterised protein [uncultured archaeon]
MGVKNEVFDQTLKHKGYFNYTDLYNFCYNWFKDNGYKNLAEEEYIEKIAPIGKEIQIKWVAKKKVSDYFRQIITVKWHILGMTDAEVEVNGKKEKTNKGEVKLKISAEVEKDWEGNWEKTPFYVMLRGIYDKYILRTTIDEYEDALTAKASNFVADTKAFLNLEGRK